MKRLLLLLVFTVLPLVAYGQQIRITLNVTSSPSPYLSDWTTRRETAILTIVNSDTKDYRVKVGVKISTGGVLQAETNIEKVPIFTVRPGINTFYGEDLVPASAMNFVGDVDKTVVRSGRLPSGSYLFCLQVFDADTRAPLSEDRCRQFTVRSYTAPRLLSPEDVAKIPPPYVRPAFQWTAVAPLYSPRQQYEIRVMEVLAGQSPTQAFRANRPILERTVTAATRLVWPSDVQIDTPMTYVWSVRALDDAGNPLGDTKDGWAEPWSFRLGRSSAVEPPRLISPANGVKIPPPISRGLRWAAPTSGATARQEYQVRMVELREGESAEQAFRANRPILDRTVIGATLLDWPSDVALDTPMAYVWSVRALDNSGRPLGDTREGWAEPWTFTMGRGSRFESPRLISPGDRAKIPPPYVRGLQWAATSGATARQQYQVKMAPVMEGQSPDEAFRANRPILDRTIRLATRLDWPSDVKIDTPMAYVWSVRALDADGNPPAGDGGWAKPWSFLYGHPGGKPYGDLYGPLGTDGADGTGQTRQIRISLNVDAHPQPYLSDWIARRETISLTVDNSSSTERSVDIRIGSGNQGVHMDDWDGTKKTVTVPPGTTVFYGEDLMPAVMQTFYGEDLVQPESTAPPAESPAQVLRTGRLPSGSYTICATLYDPATGAKVSETDCKPFTIEGDAASFAAVRAEGIAAVMFVSSSTDCSSTGKGCVDIFPKDQPSERWLAAMKKDRAATLRATYNGHVKLLPATEKSGDADTKPLDPDTLPGSAASDSADTHATSMDSVYGRPIDEGTRKPIDDSNINLTFELGSADEGPDSSVRLDDTAIISPELCRVFGVDSAKIPKGEYRLTKAPGSNGSLEFPGSAINTSRSNIKHQTRN